MTPALRAPRPRRVYLVNVGFRLAGIERRFANIWRALRARGNVDVQLVTTRVLAAELREAGLLPEARDGVIEVDLPSSVEWLVRQPTWRLGQTLRAATQSRIAARAFRRLWPAIMSDADTALHIGMPCSPLRPPDLPAVIECVDATLASFGSAYFRRASKRRVVVHCQTGRIRAALVDAYAGVETAWRPVDSTSYFADYRAMPDVARRPEQVAFVGRLETIKNPLIFVEALGLVRRAGVNVRAVMLGEGPLQTAIESAIDRLSLNGLVDVRFERNPVGTLAQSAIYASLQSGDNYGSQALLEAMGAGCAVVASDVGETRRLVTPGVGVTVPLEAAAIADALIRMLRDAEGTRRLGAEASRVARTAYTADAYAASLELLYERAMGWHRGESLLEDGTA